MLGWLPRSRQNPAPESSEEGPVWLGRPDGPFSESGLLSREEPGSRLRAFPDGSAGTQIASYNGAKK